MGVTAPARAPWVPDRSPVRRSGVMTDRVGGGTERGTVGVPALLQQGAATPRLKRQEPTPSVENSVDELVGIYRDDMDRGRRVCRGSRAQLLGTGLCRHDDGGGRWLGFGVTGVVVGSPVRIPRLRSG